MKKHVFITSFDVLLACTPKFPFHYLQKQTNKQKNNYEAIWKRVKTKYHFFEPVSWIIGTIDGMSEQLRQQNNSP